MHKRGIGLALAAVLAACGLSASISLSRRCGDATAGPSGAGIEEDKAGPGLVADLRAWAQDCAEGAVADAKAAQPVAGPTPDEIAALFEEFTVLSLADGALSEPAQLAGGPGNEVCSVTYRAGDNGPSWEFAVHARPDDVRPLCLTAEGFPPDPEADHDAAKGFVVREILGEQTDGIQLRGAPGPVKAGECRVGTWHRTLTEPWETYWLLFIDDAPQANWEHPCRYVFVSRDLSACAVQYGRSPIRRESADGPVAPLEVLIPYAPQKDMTPGEARLESDLGDRGALWDGDPSHCWAVIISGGYDQWNNHIRYWGDSAFIYSTLTLKYGYSDDHIYALISDGTDTAVDRSDGTNSPTDLDGDADEDTDYAATYANVESVFNTLNAALTAEDQLLVFVTDHGGQESGWDAVIWLWNQGQLRDDQMASMTASLPCPVMFVMEQCFSGGFVDDLSQENRVIGTAAPYNDSSWAGDTYPYYDQWCYYWTAAVRGCLPGANPWDDGAACDADANDDGYVSFKEAYDYAYENRYYLDSPQYGENPAGLGEQLFMTQLVVPVPDVQQGTVAASHKWTKVSFPEAFSTRPVVVAGPATRTDTEPGVVRVRRVTKRSFQVRFQEWDYLNGRHGKESISYLAVEPGSWSLGRGNTLLAASTDIRTTNVKRPKTIAFSRSFSANPVVLAQVQTTNGGGAVTDRIVSVRSNKFKVAMQNQEAGARHSKEIIGYVAVSQGATELGGVSCATGVTGRRVTHKPCKVGTAEGACKISIEEEQSNDSEVRHAREAVGYVAFGGDSPILVADMQTCAERDPAVVRHRTTLVTCTAAMCRLAVSAEDQEGQLLAAAVAADPALPVYPRGTAVTLHAQDSLVRGAQQWQFDHWEVDGEPTGAARAALEFKMTSDRKAVAVYKTVSWEPSVLPERPKIAVDKYE